MYYIYLNLKKFFFKFVNWKSFFAKLKIANKLIDKLIN